mgnify:CR=1 FL=1
MCEFLDYDLCGGTTEDDFRRIFCTPSKLPLKYSFYLNDQSHENSKSIHLHNYYVLSYSTFLFLCDCLRSTTLLVLADMHQVNTFETP